MLKPEIFSDNLIASSFVSRIYFFEELDSTNDYAKQNNLPDGSLVITNSQLFGKGRFRRKWESSRGKNLTFTITKKMDVEPDNHFCINCCVGYSVFNVLRNKINNYKKNESSQFISTKWPNDIILNNKKIAGVLIEKRSSKDEYIIGLGINVNQQKFSDGLFSDATSLYLETSVIFELNEMLTNIIYELEQNFKLLNEHKYLHIFNLWRDNNLFIGKEVQFTNDSGQIKRGKLEEILKSGKILLSENGVKNIYESGEIKLRIQAVNP